MPAAPELTIRDARSDELAEVSELILASYAQYAAAPTDPPEMQAAWREYRSELADVRARVDEGALAVVAEQAGRLVGAVMYYPPGSRTEGWEPSAAGVRLLAVHPEARGRGLGRVLTEECLRRARADGAGAVGLHTTTMMGIAKGMYERMGFVRVPDLDFHPAPQLIVMAYRLSL